MGRIRAFLAIDRLRPITFAVLLLLIMGRAVAPDHVRLDGLSLSLVLVAAVLALSPLLKSAKLPGGTEFRFRSKLIAAEQLGSDVQAKLYKEGYTGVQPAWPNLISGISELKQLAETNPSEALAELRQALVHGLQGGTRGMRVRTAQPDEPMERVEFLENQGILWNEQGALLRVIWDVSNSTLLAGDATTEDALRVVAVAEILSESFPLGYSLNFEQNERWEEEGLICQYEHCIERMELSGISRADHIEWRENIREMLDKVFTTCIQSANRNSPKCSHSQYVMICPMRLTRPGPARSSGTSVRGTSRRWTSARRRKSGSQMCATQREIAT